MRNALLHCKYQEELSHSENLVVRDLGLRFTGVGYRNSILSDKGGRAKYLLSGCCNRVPIV
jgi:hypothetical protein